MTKRIVNRILYILLLSGFNTLYKYISVSESMSGYNNNSSFMGAYLTSSSYQVSYLKVFILSLIALILIDFWTFVILKFVNRKKCDFKENFIKVSNNYITAICIILGGGLLFINYYLSLTVLFLSFVLYLIKLYKEVSIKTFIITIISLICSIVSLWFISN